MFLEVTLPTPVCPTWFNKRKLIKRSLLATLKIETDRKVGDGFFLVTATKDGRLQEDGWKGTMLQFQRRSHLC